MSASMMVPSVAGYDHRNFDINGKKLADIKQPDAKWMTTDDAADALCCEASTLGLIYHIAGASEALPRISRSKRGASARAVGYLYDRAGVQRLADIKRRARLSLQQAARVLVVLEVGGL